MNAIVYYTNKEMKEGLLYLQRDENRVLEKTDENIKERCSMIMKVN